MDLKSLVLYSFLISSVMLSLCIESVITKIACNKTLNIRKKSYNKTIKKIITSTTESTLAALPKEDELKPTTPYQKEFSQTAADSESVEASSKEETTTETNTNTTISTPSEDASCICGVFLSSQFVKGSSAPPKGDPIISSTLERTFACSPNGQKQCKTKCLEQIVQYLPNSAKILCASLDRDIKKEKAFLFIRNCNSKWHNTKLTAGREYCCKNGLPYTCPKK